MSFRRFLVAPKREIVYPSIIQYTSKNTGNSSGTTITVSTPTGGAFYLAFLGIGSDSGTHALSTESGRWTEAFQETIADVSTGDGLKWICAYGFHEGDATINFTGPFATTIGNYLVLYEIQDVNPDTPLDVSIVTALHNGSGTPNPPAITPTTDKTLVVCAGLVTRPHTSTNATFDTNGLSNEQTETGEGDTYSDVDIGIGTYQWTSGTYDPPAFNSSPSANHHAASCTIALRAR